MTTSTTVDDQALDSTPSLKPGGAMRVAPERLLDQGHKVQIGGGSVDSPRSMASATSGGQGGAMGNRGPGGLTMGARRVMRPAAAATAAVVGGGSDRVQGAGGLSEKDGLKAKNALRVQHHGYDMMATVGEEAERLQDEENEKVGDGAQPIVSMGMAPQFLWPGWEATLREAENVSGSAWSQRLRCFEEMTDRIRDFVGSGGSAVVKLDSVQEAGMVKVLQVVSEHVNDTHYKVAQAAMEALQQLVLSSSPVVVSHAALFLPRLFSRLGDPKEQLNALANATLNQCREILDPVVLCTAVVRVLADQTDKGKQVMLEFLQAIIPQANTHLCNPTNLRGLLHKLAFLWLTRPPITLQRALSSCLLAVLHLHSSAFFEQCMVLPSDHQAAIKSAVPDYDTYLAAAASRVHSLSGSSSTTSARKGSKTGGIKQPSSSKHQPPVSKEDTSTSTNATTTISETAQGGEAPAGNKSQTQSRKQEGRKPQVCAGGGRAPVEAWPDVPITSRHEEEGTITTTSTTVAMAPMMEPHTPTRLSRDVLFRVIVVLGDPNETPYHKSKAFKEVSEHY